MTTLRSFSASRNTTESHGQIDRLSLPVSPGAEQLTTASDQSEMLGCARRRDLFPSDRTARKSSGIGDTCWVGQRLLADPSSIFRWSLKQSPVFEWNPCQQRSDCGFQLRHLRRESLTPICAQSRVRR